MQDKVKQYIHQFMPYIRQLRDVRVAGQVLFVVLVLLISWSGVKAIQTNYTLQKQISTLQQQNQVQQLENNNLKLQNDYYNSKQYLELSARQNFGLGLPGETELTVPKEVALKYTVAPPDFSGKQAKQETDSKKPAYQRNFEAWVNFFLHRPQSGN